MSEIQMMIQELEESIERLDDAITECSCQDEGPVPCTDCLEHGDLMEDFTGQLKCIVDESKMTYFVEMIIS